MKHYVLDFVPPLQGMDDHFNTIRLGVTWSKKLAAGDRVYLQNSKTKMIEGLAIVDRVIVEKLGELCAYYGADNHTEIDSEDKCRSAERLYKLTLKLYGPHIASAMKKSTVIYLRRIE
ncbi:hypothetical protein ACWKBX_002277 [Acinetobacter baumannii]